jgi:hypothetical protein
MKIPNRFLQSLESYARGKAGEWLPDSLRHLHLAAFAVVAGVFGAAWGSVASWTALRDYAGWTPGAASLFLASIFLLGGGALFFFRDRRILEARVERERVAEERLLVPVDSSVSHPTKMRTLVWVENHPVRAALFGAAAGVALGLYARRVLDKKEEEIE